MLIEEQEKPPKGEQAQPVISQELETQRSLRIGLQTPHVEEEPRESLAKARKF